MKPNVDFKKLAIFAVCALTGGLLSIYGGYVGKDIFTKPEVTPPTE